MKTLQIIELITWYQEEDTQKRLSTLPLKTQWLIRKNIKMIEPIYNNFNEFRNELIQKRNEEWFVEGNGKCDKTTSETGEEILKIKDRYLEKFNKYDDELNSQIIEIVDEDNALPDLNVIDVDALIEAVDNECTLEINDLEALSLMGVE